MSFYLQLKQNQTHSEAEKQQDIVVQSVNHREVKPEARLITASPTFCLKTKHNFVACGTEQGRLLMADFL